MNFSAELAALKARVAALEASAPAAIEARRREAAAKEAAEEAQRQREVAENTRRQQELHRANERQREENWITHEKAEKAARQKNGGRFKDPCGVWRTADGKVAALADHERQAAKEVMKQKEER